MPNMLVRRTEDGQHKAADAQLMLDRHIRANWTAVTRGSKARPSAHVVVVRYVVQAMLAVEWFPYRRLLPPWTTMFPRACRRPSMLAQKTEHTSARASVGGGRQTVGELPSYHGTAG
jgi:hypothetical protein